ncbi:regulator of nonsense transcripts UPF3-like [Sesamum indicum]|uniref:Regulator of nonsense transcripts UPF3-like n=1 Tax=Sesamum indicum TaxID=4182 RepID=A0A6I9U3X3_SESIN|nr:regulator of nonsense transcripts UPF3-like [Sesamum indicum]XP_011092290.1 regulator of nonsense transcripts UPF3-like [Sesamum indicum]XP_011092291.1 regulator of nonsense transcripts UPF3-like [Sesamum indicum]
MKGPLDRTKVVLRHLPPTISQSNLFDHVDSRFSGRYRWSAFRPGKSSQKHLTYSRAYIDFNRPEDVLEFAEFFNGHVFVNEKGTQFKAIVEYAPSQRVPKQWSKKDGREGTILKDPEYLEFLEFLAKPVENLPSAEIQLERKEAERAGAPKDVPIVTPLMDYVRQKRAAKGGARRTMLNGKSTRRVGGISSRSPVSGSSKRGSEKRKTSTMYVLRDSSKGASSKEKPTYLLVPKQDDQQLTEKSANLAAVSRTDALELESGGSGSTGIAKKKILLLKGKEKEISNVSGGSSLQQNAATPAKSSQSSAPSRQNQRRETSGRIIRSILLNKDNRQNQPLPVSQSEPRIHNSNQERDKKPPRSPSIQLLQKETNGIPEDKVVSNDLHAVHTEKQDRRMRNKDRPDRGVWTPLRRSDGSHASDDSLSSSASRASQVLDPAEDVKNEMLVARGGEYRQIGSGRGGHYSVDNGSFRHGRRSSAYNIKDVDGSSVLEGKPSRRGGSSGYGPHEKQVWVQKSSSGS